MEELFIVVLIPFSSIFHILLLLYSYQSEKYIAVQ